MLPRKYIMWISTSNNGDYYLWESAENEFVIGHKTQNSTQKTPSIIAKIPTRSDAITMLLSFVPS